MDFDEIWPRFSWVLEDMRNGIAFFEGYVPVLGEGDLLGPLQAIIERAESHSFRTSTWSSDTTPSDWEGEYSDSEYVSFFGPGRIYTLNFDYAGQVGETPLRLQLMFRSEERRGGQECVRTGRTRWTT